MIFMKLSIALNDELSHEVIGSTFYSILAGLAYVAMLVALRVCSRLIL